MTQLIIYKPEYIAEVIHLTITKHILYTLVFYINLK